jgi:1,2-diacylglycerol 3-alpha-glucosyltransferase
MKKLTIGIFIDVFYPMVDGVVKVTDHQASILSKHHKVYVFAPKAKDKNYKDDFPYEVMRVMNIHIPTTDYQLALPQFDTNLNKKLKTIKFDIIHIQSPFSMGELGIKVAKKQNIPVVATLHSQYEKDFYERTKSKTITKVMLSDIMMRLNKCDITITMNEGSKALFMRYGLKKEPLIVPNATDMILASKEDVLKVRQDYAIQDVFNMMFVGRMDKIKNIDFMIDVIVQLKKKTKQFHMYFIGKGTHEVAFQSRVNELKLSDVITFTGPIYDRNVLAAFYQASDLLMFPSTYDTNGLVQIEAASQYTPGIFLNGTLAASSIIDQYNGYLSEENPVLFSRKIHDVMNHQEHHQNVSKKAHETLYLTWEEVVLNIEKIYDQLTKESKNG